MIGEHPLRASLLDAVRAAPGLSTRAAAARCGCSDWTADYHLRRLAKEGQVTTEPRGRSRSWYSVSCGLCPVLRRAMPELRRPEALALAMAAQETPTSMSRLAARAGVAPGTARWVAQALVDTFLFERSRSGRVNLRPGAGTCIAKAAGNERCSLWGKCPVSREWAQARPAEATVRPPRT